MKATATNLLKFLQGTRQFVVPIYQRTYSWEQSDCQQLLNDILRVAVNDDVPAHFVGSIVYVERGIYHVSSVTQLLVIDGQQRLTTLSLLLALIGEMIEATGKDHRGEITRKKIHNYYLFNTEEDGDARYKLLLTQSDRDTLIQLLEGRELPEPVSERMRDNYQFFKDYARRNDIDPFHLYKGVSKLVIVDIALDQEHDNPQLIFESLNSTGVALSQADLIRNYVLMGLEHEEQNRLYTTYWYPMEQSFRYADKPDIFDRFMRDYLTLKQGEIPNIGKVYAAFKAYHQSNISTPIANLVKDIYRYAKYFAKMAFLKEEDREIRSVLHDIDILTVYVAYPFLLEVYDDYANQRLTHLDFIAILRLVESYVFRRAVCGLPTNALNKVFAALPREIDKEHYIESVVDAFLSKGYGARFPRDEEFRQEFVVKDIYHLRSNTRSYLFSKLENFERKEPITIDEYSIEHIMPQNERLSAEWQQELGSDWQEIHARYLHTIGNLTLTRYNSELSDHPFQEKRDKEGGFADSPVRLNRGLAKLEHWNETEIKKRAEQLADLATHIWTMSPLTAEQQIRVSRQPQTRAASLTNGNHHYTPADYQYLQGSMLELFERLRRRILNLDASVKEEYRKFYIAYKMTTNFVDIEPQKKRLLISLNTKFSEIDDPKRLCRDLTGKGHFGNGDVEIGFSSMDQLDDVMYLVRQSFDRHWEEDDA
jgi:uncharacterized protein with ParB-like and HNH nuclease domain/predicted transport protein